MSGLAGSEPIGAAANWQPDLASFVCQACQRKFLLPPDMQAAACPICAMRALALEPARMRSEAPESSIANQVSPQQAQRIFEGFCQGVPFKADDLTPQNLLARSQLLYWPCWLLDGDLNGDWSAEMGFSYQVKTAKESLGGGNWQSQDKLRTQMRWEERLGRIQRHYDNRLIPALRRHQERMRRLGNYDLRLANNFDPNAPQRMLVELPDLQPDEVSDQGKQALSKAAGSECMTASGAQDRRGFVFRGSFDNLNWTQLLLPMLTSWYQTDNGQRVPVAVNGQSGQVVGARLASMRKARKLAALILGILLVFVIVLAALMGVFRTEQISGVGLTVLCMGLPLSLILAALPLVRASQWNEAQKKPENNPS